MTNQKSIDAPSLAGQFGWERIGPSGSNLAIPVILRSNLTRYSPVRIVEQEIIKRYEALPQSVFQCITLKSFYLTATEAKLLNDINFNHCNNRYGDNCFSTRDVIISAPDVKELSRFLNISLEVFTRDLTQVSENFGLIKFKTDSSPNAQTLLIPYLRKSYQDPQGYRVVRFVPLKLVEHFVNMNQKCVKASPTDWDIMYMKMFCIFSKNNLERLITRNEHIVLLEGLLYPKDLSPVRYEDFKPITSETTTANTWQ